MINIERFPVSRKDLEQKNISCSARKLIKVLDTEMKLGQGREIIAKVLGYMNCNELNQEAKNNSDCSLSTLVEKSKAYLKVAINLSNILNMPLSEAIGLVNHLGLHYYSAMKNCTSNTTEFESFEFQIESSEQAQNERKEKIEGYHCKNTNVVVTFKPRRKFISP